MIEVRSLKKTFRVHVKEPGLKASVRSLFKRDWKEKHALQGINLSVGRGEILGLVGANGAGKTTLVKILSGIIHPTSGEARVLGYVPWERQNAFRREIALIMGQKAQLWWDLPAGDCFRLLKEIYQIPDSTYRENLAELSETLGVTSLFNVQIRRLSLGERMKMELIAALLHRPKVVFLDEPTIGLDFSAQRAIREFILAYRETHRPAMILTSHYMEDIERLCERLVIIRDGAFVYDGPLKSILNEFGMHKVITASVEAPHMACGPIATGLNLPSDDVSSHDGNRIRIRVARHRVQEAAGFLLSRMQVSDLNIEDTDIATIIEGLMKK